MDPEPVREIATRAALERGGDERDDVLYAADAAGAIADVASAYRSVLVRTSTGASILGRPSSRSGTATAN